MMGKTLDHKKLLLATTPKFRQDQTPGILSPGPESPMEEATHLPRLSSAGRYRTQSAGGSGSHHPSGGGCHHPPGRRLSSCSPAETGPRPLGHRATGNVQGKSPRGEVARPGRLSIRARRTDTGLSSLRPRNPGPQPAPPFPGPWVVPWGW